MIMDQTEVRQIVALMTTAEVAELLKVNRSTLSRWRSLGIGPRVTWLSPSIPRYRRADVQDWLRRAAA
jgi:predicted DNA-binding transcriptional regulator AlpA